MALQEGRWIRGRKVEVRKEDLYCELAVDRPYDLVDSYPKDPHVQFLNCETDADIQRFVRSWGPLYLRYGGMSDELQSGFVIRPLQEYRATLRRFKAVKGLVDAARGNRYERSSLLEFLSADEQAYRLSSIYSPESLPSMHLALQVQLGLQGDLIRWTERCSPPDLRKALAFCIECEVTAPWPGGLKVLHHKNKLAIVPSYRLYTLEDALKWMVWFDEWKNWPPIACSACRKIFRPLSHHKRKYCSYQCAHRIAIQNWRKKKAMKRSSA